MKIVTLANQEKFMKSITRLSLALMMFSLFSISYLVTSVSAQNGMKCGKPNRSDFCSKAEIAVQEEKNRGFEKANMNQAAPGSQ